MKKNPLRKPRGFIYDKDKYFLNNIISTFEGRRKVLKLTQLQLAEMADTSQQSYSKWMNPEKGKGNVDILLFKKLVTALQLTDQEIVSIIRKE